MALKQQFLANKVWKSFSKLFSNFSKLFQTFGNCPKFSKKSLEKNGNLPTSATRWSICTCYTLHILNIYNVYVDFMVYTLYIHSMYRVYTMYIPSICIHHCIYHVYTMYIHGIYNEYSLNMQTSGISLGYTQSSANGFVPYLFLK